MPTKEGKPQPGDWVLNPNYDPDDPDSVYRQAISLVSGTRVKTLAFNQNSVFSHPLWIPTYLLSWDSKVKAWRMRSSRTP